MATLTPTMRVAPSWHRITVPGIRHRVRARVRAITLDRELARGVAPASDPALMLRARDLSGPTVAGDLGHQLRSVMREAHRPVGPSARLRPCRARVIAAEHELRLLASRLHSPQKAALVGLAQVRVLLTDGSGPLYYRDSAEDLGAAIRKARLALR